MMLAEPAWRPSEGSGGLILDLGANHGEFALAAAQRNPGLDVLAIEPIPALADLIEARARADGLDRLRCLRVAVDEADGDATLNVQSQADRGVSSLLSFDRRSLERDEYWRERSDLAFDAALPVTVRRLDALLPPNPGPIRFAKIDVQGRDVQALRSLGQHLSQLDGGMLEIPGTLENRLYEAEVIDLAGAVAELRGLGFEIHAVKPNDPAGNEYNLFFHRRGVDWRRLEEELGLRGIPLYAGKHFWHLPSDRLRHAEAEFAQLGVRAAAAEARHEAAAAALVDTRQELADIRQELADTQQKLADARQALSDALTSAGALRRDNARLSDGAAALREALRQQQDWCTLLRSERNGPARPPAAE